MNNEVVATSGPNKGAIVLANAVYLGVKALIHLPGNTEDNKNKISEETMEGLLVTIIADSLKERKHVKL